MQVVRKIIFLLAILVINPGVVLAHVGGEGETVVHMTDSGFEPKEVVVRYGETVVFENVDENPHWPASNIHPIHQNYPDFDTKRPIRPSQSWNFTFNRSGEWGMHDHLYPQYKGKIVVRSQGSALPPRDEEEKERQSRGLFGRIVEVFKRIFFRTLSFLPESLLTNKAQRRDAVSGYSTEFVQPQDARVEDIYKELEFDCDSTDYSCTGNALRRETDKYGPQAVLDILELLREEGQVSKSVDEHQLAHEIGRQTAKSFGLNSQAFLLCSMSAFNGGCQHGYFEYVLGKTDTTTEAADLICKSLGPSYSSKDNFYCYHGVGHGVMMARAYDLAGALNTCDEFSDQMAQEGCWQGLFMENVAAGRGGIAREGVFSEEDPLAPCNKVDEKYRWQCFINHAGYLMDFFDSSIIDAASACLKAGVQISACFQSLGLVTTNSGLQYAITGKDKPKKTVEIALEVCGKFPKVGQNDCFIGALDNIMNFDQMDLAKRALTFCDRLRLWSKEACYGQIGINIAGQVVSLDERKSLCEQVDPDYHQACFEGAGL